MNPLYIAAGGVGLLALLLAGTASAKPKPNSERRGDGTRKDMPANDTTDPDFEPVLTDTDLVLEWTKEVKELPPEVPPAAPSKQPIDPPNYGTPPGTYDVAIFRTPLDVRAFFATFGYIPMSAVNETPMNGLGPDKKLGGGDDEPSAIVRDFQVDYNLVSNSLEGSTWGTLDEDGLVGPHTLNALQHARERAGDTPDTDLATWWASLVEPAIVNEGPLDG